MTVLDVFSHFTPKATLDEFAELRPDLPALAAFRRLPELWDPATRLASMEPFPELQQVLNMGNPPVEVFGAPAVAARLARQANEALATLAAAHPDRFPAFTAVLPMNDIDLALSEIDYAVDALGARGVQLYTNVLGTPLSESRFRPVFLEMARRDLPVLVHPYRGPDANDYATEPVSEHEIWFTFGWPYESTAFAARMVYSGIFDEVPDLKIVLHHFGGMIPSFGERIGLGFRQIFAGAGAANPVAVEAGLSGDVSEHFHRFYADTALNGSVAGVACGYAFFGPGRSLFGTDAPFSPRGGVDFVSGALAAVDALGLRADARARLLEGNARALFGLPDVRTDPQVEAQP